MSVEGNIGCGKSTLLKYFEKYSNKVQTIREPIDKWTNLQGHNLLVCFSFKKFSVKYPAEEKTANFSHNDRTCGAEIHGDSYVTPIVYLHSFMEGNQSGWFLM